ncbi:hypothetical protein U9M48_007814 [Paspalum notatum var. saurae]|uniref:DUF4378 domain-containing protein n=1 Tax=Paspalum notatum var. saurae TaxID=547442 RepID=A0AAQ3SMW2_PASNO
MAAGGAGATPPLRLKDLLELDCDSCSAAGFRCYPRRLLGDSPSSLSAAGHLLDSSSSSLSLRGRRRPSKLSHLSRSISRRLSRGRGFWRRRDDDDVEEEEQAVSTGCEETTTSSSESSDNSSRRRSRASSGDSSDFSSSASTGDEHEEAMKKRGSSEEADDCREEQLSPVAVMDFPAADDDDSGAEDRGSGGGGARDDGGAAAGSPSFSLERLQRRNMHKIRRFGSRDDLGPVDLKPRLAATCGPGADSLAVADDDATAQKVIVQCRPEDAATPTCASGAGAGVGVRDAPDDERVLVPLLMGMVSASVDDDVTERLLLDFFFAEMKRRRSAPHAEAERVVDGEAVAAARCWLEGTGAERWGLKDVLGAGEDVVAEMERGRRWMQVGEEEREIGAVVAGMLADQVVDEAVWDLLV